MALSGLGLKPVGARDRGDDERGEEYARATLC
jgi:hypothetical protein